MAAHMGHKVTAKGTVTDTDGLKVFTVASVSAGG